MDSGTWEELGDGVFVRSYRSLSLNVGVVFGSDGLLVFDSRESPARGRELRGAIAAISKAPVRWLVNSHFHWDHTFGNPAFRPAQIWGHPLTAAFLGTRLEEARASALRWLPELGPELAELAVDEPGHLVDSDTVIDMGDRHVGLHHLGRGHTDSDIVMVVPDAEVVFGGDLIESSGPPQFGDAYPHDWAPTLGRLLELRWSTAVPGHGPAMSPGEVATQMGDLAAVSRTCRLAERGQADHAVSSGPYPAETMAAAVERCVAVRSDS